MFELIKNVKRIGPLNLRLCLDCYENWGQILSLVLFYLPVLNVDVGIPGLYIGRRLFSITWLEAWEITKFWEKQLSRNRSEKA